MTTLFNLFCPFVFSFSLNGSIFMMLVISFFVINLLMVMWFNKLTSSFITNVEFSMFPSLGGSFLFFVTWFFSLSLLNLTSLMIYSFPVTTTLAFNLSVALTLWVMSIMILSLKGNWISSLLPVNSPWYLVPFLSLVEMVSISVRPITLCFRLLANMTAGHILLSLICKLPLNTWLLGILFGMLELLVSMVQAFVFLMLISVYLEEGFSH